MEQQYQNQNQNPQQYQNTQQWDRRLLYPAMKVTDWVLTFLVLCIPIANIVMLFVWAFSSTTNPSKKSFCRAYLILVGIVIALYCGIIVMMLFVTGVSGGFTR